MNTLPNKIKNLNKSKKSFLVPTGISVAFSEDYEIQIRPRSGLAAKKSISIFMND